MLAERIERAADEATNAGPGPWIIDENENGLQFHCELTAREQLACAFTKFELKNQAWAAAPINRVKQVAENLAKRLTYLLEPIRPIEVDAEHCLVQMRSNPPRRDESRTSYYELEVRRGGVLSLCRYEKQPHEVRRQVPIQVTREVFRHLLDDFAAAS